MTQAELPVVVQLDPRTGPLRRALRVWFDLVVVEAEWGAGRGPRPTDEAARAAFAQRRKAWRFAGAQAEAVYRAEQASWSRETGRCAITGAVVAAVAGCRCGEGRGPDDVQTSALGADGGAPGATAPERVRDGAQFHQAK